MATSLTETPNPLGAEIRRVRESLGLTLMQFGVRVSIPWQTIAAYEAGRAVPPADRFLAIVHAGRKASKPFRVERIALVLARAAA